MPDTPNYAWALPTLAGDPTTWDDKLNAVFDKAIAPLGVDQVVKAVSDVADAALPKAGGVMTGRLDAHSGTLKLVAKGSISGAQSLDLSAANYFTMTITGATTISVANVPSGTFATGLIMRIVNGGTNITWPASFKWPLAAAPVLTASGTDMLALVTDDSGTTWRQVGKTLDVR